MGNEVAAWQFPTSPVEFARRCDIRTEVRRTRHTLAGVVLAFFIPLRTASAPDEAPLRKLERDLHPSVAYAIVPIFAFANAGVSLAGLSFSAMLEVVRAD